MKKNKFTEFFKGKGYYVLLFVGVIAIAAVALIGSQLSTTGQKDQNKEFVDLNDTDRNIAAKDDTKVADNNKVSKDDANKASVASADKNSKDVAGNDVELDDYSNVGGNTKQAKANAKEEAVQTEGKSVKNSDAQETLSFNTGDELKWPVDGNVIMNFSMDHTTLFATLMQYKCNPAIIIDAKVGTKVKAATDGIVTDIKPNEETGYTVTMNIGNNYELTYGQLDKKSVNLKVGDKVDSGTVIGKVDDPTKYYSVEGSNLYFEVTEKDKPVDPMLYLK